MSGSNIYLVCCFPTWKIIMKKNPTAIALLESLENYITDLKEYFDNPVDDVEEIKYDVTDKAESLLEEFNDIVGQTKTSYE